MKKLIFIMLFVLLGVSHGAAENVDVLTIYKGETGYEVADYDLLFHRDLNELTYVYKKDDKIIIKKLVFKNNKITEQTSKATTYTFPERKYLKRHKFNIDLFKNFLAEKGKIILAEPNRKIAATFFGKLALAGFDFSSTDKFILQGAKTIKGTGERSRRR